MPELSDRDRAILAFENQWTRSDGAKEFAIRSTFELSAARYYQILNRLIDAPEALKAEPVLVKRLLRLRLERTANRAARTP
jgi:hypothetical protein